MDDQVAALLAGTQSPQAVPRKQAEDQLAQLYNHQEFPLSLMSIASQPSVSLQIRQAALLYTKTFVQAAWSPHFDEYKGEVEISDVNKQRLRQTLVNLATSETEERKIRSAASAVVGKIASADFPDSWPDLLPALLHTIKHGTQTAVHGALKVLLDLVDDCFNEDQFLKAARDVVETVHGVAVNIEQKPTLRALAVSTFRSCFDMLEMILESHKAEVKGFAEQAISGWDVFFQNTLRADLPPAPSEDEEDEDAKKFEYYRGMIALKLQVVKILMRIRSIFPAILGPQSVGFFLATWEELNKQQAQYQAMYIESDRQGRLEDADGLPYTLDFLILELLDAMQAFLRAPPVKKELAQQLENQMGTNGDVSRAWITEVMKLAVSYGQITTEEEGLWDIDVNIFLSEETNVTANYTPRTACGDLVIKLGEWLPGPTVAGLLAYTQTLYSSDTSWKAKEAALYLLNQLLGDFQDVNRNIAPEAASGYVQFIQYAMEQDDVFLRARGHLVAGGLIRTSGDALMSMAPAFMHSSLRAMSTDPSDVVKVSCIRAIQAYLSTLPPATTLPLQSAIINNLNDFLAHQDINELSESEDVMVAIVETLRDTLLLNTSVCLTGPGLELLFSLASNGAANFQLAMLITETFEEISSTLAAAGPDSYAQLCAKVLPSLTGAFDLANMTTENSLSNLAADLLAVLAAEGASPLPQGFVATVMPKLQHILLVATDDELLKSATAGVKSMIEHDASQVFAWQDLNGRGGLEVILTIIDRLLSPSIDDNAATEVGGLAAELVEKAGADKLGPYLEQLLRAVAIRLASATRAQFIQSLILVFARLSLVSPREIVDFLCQIQIENESGLQVVMVKWLENSVNFAGYDEIRQNVIALSKLYELDDSRLAQVSVKGDLIVKHTGRIMTRSRARENPDQYTIVPANLKIVKVLVEELLHATGTQEDVEAQAAAATEDGESGDDEWEDEGNDFLDLGLGSTKEQLMAYGDDGPSVFNRGRDDETQAYLLQFFRQQAEKPGFEQVFQSLNPDEQNKLRDCMGQQ